MSMIDLIRTSAKNRQPIMSFPMTENPHLNSLLKEAFVEKEPELTSTK